MPLWLLLFSTLTLSIPVSYQIQFNSTMFSFCRFFLHPSDLFTTTLPPRFTLPPYSKLSTLTQNYTNTQKTPSICLMQHECNAFIQNIFWWFKILTCTQSSIFGRFHVEFNSQIQLLMSESIKLIKNIKNNFVIALPSEKKLTDCKNRLQAFYGIFRTQNSPTNARERSLYSFDLKFVVWLFKQGFRTWTKTLLWL